MSAVIEGIKRTTRAAIGRRDKAIEAVSARLTKALGTKAIRADDQAILDGISILAKQGECAFAEADSNGLVIVTAEHRGALGMGGDDGQG